MKLLEIDTTPSWDIFNVHARYGDEGYLKSSCDTEDKAVERLKLFSTWVQYRKSILELRYKGEVLARSVKGVFEDYRTY